MASSLQSRVLTLSFSSSISSSSTALQWRPSLAFRYRPTRKIFTVHAKIREIFMPALSSTMTEGKIVSWIKSEGDLLSKGDLLYDGILAAIVVGEGETAPVGAPIGLLAETEAEIAEAKAKASNSSAPITSDCNVSPNVLCFRVNL